MAMAATLVARTLSESVPLPCSPHVEKVKNLILAAGVEGDLGVHCQNPKSNKKPKNAESDVGESSPAVRQT